jgi:hypothetical protein
MHFSENMKDWQFANDEGVCSICLHRVQLIWPENVLGYLQ